MPLQVAAGNFDLALTGRDWLHDHLARFPASPVAELLNLGFGWVRLVAVVAESMPAHNISELRRLMNSGNLPRLRIASEYAHLADKYAWDNHLSPYRLIPTWGASEAFLPEDADLLIENTQTGRTLAEHKLRVIDTLFESTACLVGNRHSLSHPAKAKTIGRIVACLQGAL
jgi:ATP phosphoribosyltransferase